MATSLKDTSVTEIERALDEFREHELSSQRTSVLTHAVWVPPEWSRAVERVMVGLGQRVPSRTILLHPDPRAGETRLDARVQHECFSASGHETCAEWVHIWLRGETAKAPASIVVPLQLPDLPAFLRWRGKPAFGSGELEQLIGATDRLIVDSSEWGDRLRPAYRRLAELFNRICVSDLAWARGLPHRAGLAALWPGIKQARVLEVNGPLADARLLHGWLRSRLKTGIRLHHEQARSLTGVAVDGEPVHVPRHLVRTASDQLSDELEIYTRDRIYEAAVRAA